MWFSQVGDEGAGHFVKMVHNGIEYGDMQLICEAYHLMRDVLCMGHAEMAKVSLGRGGAGVLRARSCLTLRSHGLKPTRLLSMGILQARILEWVATGFSRGSSRPRGLIHVSCIGRWVFLPPAPPGKPQGGWQ